MSYEVRAEQVGPRQLAAVRAVTSPKELSTRIIGLLEQWCARNGREPAGVNWEIYGDWEDDPAKRRTDVYFLLS